MFTVRVYVRSQGEVPSSQSNNFLPSGLLFEWDKGQFLSLVGSCGSTSKVTGLLMDTGNFWEEICWTLTYSHGISGSFLKMLLFSPPRTSILRSHRRVEVWSKRLAANRLREHCTHIRTSACWGSRDLNHGYHVVQYPYSTRFTRFTRFNIPREARWSYK